MDGGTGREGTFRDTPFTLQVSKAAGLPWLQVEGSSSLGGRH